MKYILKSLKTGKYITNNWRSQLDSNIEQARRFNSHNEFLKFLDESKKEELWSESVTGDSFEIVTIVE